MGSPGVESRQTCGKAPRAPFPLCKEGPMETCIWGLTQGQVPLRAVTDTSQDGGACLEKLADQP